MVPRLMRAALPLWMRSLSFSKASLVIEPLDATKLPPVTTRPVPEMITPELFIR